ncbi:MULTISPECIES: hypothetical protein [Saccharothrix]|uniref:hypothetical protein n=1 Tax=Saccharothrix TaxID=2071 RepID=UPI0009397F90|nr:hypothetical protein [Saccharothrix sp. CB00851]OKI38872.1 hypothetical protein A6A25_01325 [Saccharothrix sp. CB00851]
MSDELLELTGQATPDEIVAMWWLQQLLNAGFQGARVGEDPLEPVMLGYARWTFDVVELVRVYSPSKAEAARLVGGKIALEADGTVREVVRAVLGWPKMISVVRGFPS